MTGTTLAAIAAVGGLWAQAVASYWTQQTAKDQLSESRDDDVRRARDQASKVTYWGGGGSAFDWGGTGTQPAGGTGTGALHVLNRSPDPIPAAEIALTIRRKTSSTTWVIPLSNIPPCTHLAYPQTKMFLGLIHAAGEERPKVYEGDNMWTPVAMHFTDTQGRQWRRTQRSLSAGEAPSVINEARKLRKFVQGTEPVIRKASACDSR